MEKNLKKLKELIKKQTNLLGLIKTIEKSKNEILSQGKLMDFSALTENQTSLMAENIKLEKEREVILKAVYGEDLKDLKFSQIIEKTLDQPLKQELNLLFNQLKEKVTEIKILTSTNQELIEIALQVIDLTLSQGEISKQEIDYTQKSNIENKSLLVNQLI